MNEEDVFSELENVLTSGMMSSMIGWAIQQGKAVEATGGIAVVVANKESLQTIYQRKEPAELGTSPEEGLHLSSILW